MSEHFTRLGASEAARQIGVTTKALRLYEQRGLVTPGRTAAGYRVYGSAELLRASEVATLRALGLSLAQVERVLEATRKVSIRLSVHTQRVLNEKSANLCIRSTESAGFGRKSRAARCRPIMIWHVCKTPPLSSPQPSIFPGLGAGNGSRFGKSCRSITSSVPWEAAKPGWRCGLPKNCQMQSSWV
jgi:DNA-binding transcriptional MerR regulator